MCVMTVSRNKDRVVVEKSTSISQREHKDHFVGQTHKAYNGWQHQTTILQAMIVILIVQCKSWIKHQNNYETLWVQLSPLLLRLPLRMMCCHCQ